VEKKLPSSCRDLKRLSTKKIGRKEERGGPLVYREIARKERGKTLKSQQKKSVPPVRHQLGHSLKKKQRYWVGKDASLTRKKGKVERGGCKKT